MRRLLTRTKDIVSTCFNPHGHGEKYDLIIYVVPTEPMKSRMEIIFDDLAAQGRFFVMTMEVFKQRFTKTDLGSRLEAIELRRTRDKIAEQKREQQKAGLDKIDRKELAERERQALLKGV